MTNSELTLLVLDKLNWDYDKELNLNRHRKTCTLYAGPLIEAILDIGTVTEAAKHLDFSYKVVNTAITREFVPIFGNLNGGNATWKFQLEHYAQYQHCAECRKLLPYTAFHLDTSKPRGHCCVCKDCRVPLNAANYQKESTKEVHRRSYEKNKEAIRTRNARYRADRLLRCPGWVDLVGIALVYKNCPEGYHVDHILPLKGELVSGLHTVENLQYLRATDNLSKNNSFDLEKFNSEEVWYKTNIPDSVLEKAYSRTVTPLSREKFTKVCPYCNTTFEVQCSKQHQVCCSKSCAVNYARRDKLTDVAQGLTKEYVQELIWNKPYSIGCKDVGLSDNGLKKMAIRLGCVMPPYRYHTKSIADKKQIKEAFSIRECGEIG